MADSPETKPQEAQAETATERDLLKEAILATPVEAERAKDLIGALIDQAMKGTVVFDKNLTHTIEKGIAAIDAEMSKQLAAIMHHPKFQKLEGAWRGLKYLVFNSETSKTLKIRVLNATKRDLLKDFEKATEFDQSHLFKKIYTNEFGMPGGEPYGALIGDYEFSAHPEDIDLLRHLSGVCAASFCPFISAASPKMFGFDDYTALNKPRDLERIFQSPDYIPWKSFRDSDDSRYVTLAMPRVLSRPPFGSFTKSIDEFNYEEVEMDGQGKPRSLDHHNYTWMNAAYVLGTRLTDSFAKYGWCTMIRGAESGGKVENLPCHTFYTMDGDMDTKCPTEIGIPDRREAELSKLGFLPLCHFKNTDYSVFFGGQTTQEPKKYDSRNATENAQISARLPYILSSSRIAHYLKVIARDKIGGFMERGDVEDFLKRWLAQYVCADKKPPAEVKAKFPLAEAKVEVREVPGKPGSYDAVAWIRPWLYFEELNASLRMVARLPAAKK